MNASRQIGNGSITAPPFAAAMLSNRPTYCGGTMSLSDSPGSGTKAFTYTRRLMRSGIASAAAEITMPP